ncbi:MAG: ABC transporter permease [Acidimicrobiales bacterium]|nr:ABC transporter permease [Acidimicrobiales bacterium]
MKRRWGRVAAIARNDLRLLLTDMSFLIVMTIAPLGFMAFSREAFGLALQSASPGVDTSGAAFVVPAGTVLFSGFMVGNIGFWTFREHGWGTWERLRAADVSTGSLMLGKSIVPVLTLVLQLVVLLGAGVVLFGLEITGTWAAFLVVAAALALMEVALGFMLLALCRSVMQLNAITNAGTLLLGGLGGAMAPIEMMPGWAQSIAPAIPAYWAMKGFRLVTMEGAGVHDVLGPVSVLLAFAVLFGAVALLRFEVESSKVSWA